MATRSGIVTTMELAAAIRDREPHVEVVLTGRGCPDELLDLADYITELRAVRHPFERGVPARIGVEY